MTLKGITENLLSDTLFVLLLGFVGWLWVTLTRRRALQNFFALANSKRIVLYVSNIRVLAFGSVGISGQKMSYQGSCVAQGEMQAATTLRNLFSFFIPLLGEASGLLSRLLLSDVSAQVMISPISQEELESEASFVSLGSSAYNAASRYIEELPDTVAKFRYGTIKKADLGQDYYVVRPTAFSTDAEVHVTPSGSTASLAEFAPYGNPPTQDQKEQPSAIIIDGVPPITDPTYGFIQRTADEQPHRALFYVAGLSEYSTSGAAHYLASHWRTLHRKYPSEAPFLLMLRFDPRQFTKCAVVFERVLRH